MILPQFLKLFFLLVCIFACYQLGLTEDSFRNLLKEGLDTKIIVFEKLPSHLHESVVQAYIFDQDAKELQNMIESNENLSSDYQIILLENVSDLDNLNAIDMDQTSEIQWLDILSKDKKNTLITIDNSDQFFDRGGSIQCVVTGNKLKSKINLEGIPENVRFSSK